MGVKTKFFVINTLTIFGTKIMYEFWLWVLFAILAIETGFFFKKEILKVEKIIKKINVIKNIGNKHQHKIWG